VAESAAVVLLLLLVLAVLLLIVLLSSCKQHGHNRRSLSSNQASPLCTSDSLRLPALRVVCEDSPAVQTVQTFARHRCCYHLW
jgi:hypothetical protein